MIISAILRQLRQGSQLAFKRLYDLHSAKVYALAFHIVKDEKHAEELVQDTFMEIWNHRQRIDSQGNISTYLYVICRNKSFNKLKELKRHKTVFDPSGDQKLNMLFLAEDIQATRELKESIEHIMSKLPPRQQEIFRLSRLDGFSHKEIADQLGISVQTVKNHMVAALRFVRTELANSSDQVPPLMKVLIALSYFSLQC